jgi:hypothetical protein
MEHHWHFCEKRSEQIQRWEKLTRNTRMAENIEDVITRHKAAKHAYGNVVLIGFVLQTISQMRNAVYR